MTSPPTSVEPQPARRWRRLVRRWVLFLVGLYVGAVLLMWFLENALVYHPLTAAESWEPAPPGTENVSLMTADGTGIHAWWLPRGAGEASGSLLFCHGNGGNLSHRGPEAARLRDVLGLGVLIVDYPGYGKSEGKPTEGGCIAAADAGYDWLTRGKKVAGEKIVLFGESLGGGVAADLAARHPHAALVLLKTFTSLPAAARHHYPWLPTHLLMSNRFDVEKNLAATDRPVFIAGATADRVVPFSHSERLYAAARGPKRSFRLEGLDHNHPLPADFYTALRDFLAEHALGN